jgi:hypothetical protein
MTENASSVNVPAHGYRFELTQDLRNSFAGCPDRPRMSRTLQEMKLAARQDAADRASAEPPKLIRRRERSFITGKPLDLALTYGDAADPSHPGPQWHLSESEMVGGRRQPVSEAELAGWVIAGFDQATRFTTYTLATGTARHADIPAGPPDVGNHHACH